jgi:hypothetical protein
VSPDKTADVLADAARGGTTPDEQPTLEVRAERRSGDVGAAAIVPVRVAYVVGRSSPGESVAPVISLSTRSSVVFIGSVGDT